MIKEPILFTAKLRKHGKTVDTVQRWISEKELVRLEAIYHKAGYLIEFVDTRPR